LSGAIARCTPVSKMIEPSENEKPAITAAAAIRGTDACAASKMLWTLVSAKIAPTTTHGRPGRTRRPTSAPASAPIPSPATTAPHAPAPPRSCFAMYGPSTKNGA
jgi:hypothetical protein